MSQRITIQKQGNKIISGRERLAAVFNSLEEGYHEITVEKKKKPRSLQQNAYYWSCVVPMVFDGLKAMGFEAVKTREHAHLIMKSLFLKVTIPDQNGVAIEWIKSTAELKTVGFMEYLEKIYQWSAEYLGINIPSPSSQINMYDAP